jgi:DedD protein
MDQQLKQRLVGAAVLVALGVIFIPMLLQESTHEPRAIDGSVVPPKPEGEFSSRIIPIEPEPPAEPGEEPQPPLALAPGDAAALAADPDAETPPVADGDGEQRVGVTAWVVQLGSFASEANAQALEQRLRSAGYSAFVERLAGGEGQIYRVRVGPELLRSEADSLRSRLEQEIKIKGIVMRYP